MPSFKDFAPQHPEAKNVEACIKGAFKAEQMYEDGKLPLEMKNSVKLNLDKSKSGKNDEPEKRPTTKTAS